VTEFSSDDLANQAAPDTAPSTDSWEGILANLRRRYPGQKDSVLFCLHKLHSNPELGLPDFREEAALHGIPMAGRALHSAKVLLGLASVKPRVSKPKAEPASSVASESLRHEPRVRRLREASSDHGSIETKVLDAVRQIQSAAGAEAERLRTALRQAITILQDALDD
jgi:hypothetical protein